MARTHDRVSFRDTSASVALDAVRGAAALLVLLDHTHNLFFVTVDVAMQASAHPRLTQALYAVNAAGVEAVVIFFVLSGYLISGSVFRALEQGRWSWKEYLTNRLVRLWLVLIPALAVGGLWDSARLTLQSRMGISAGTPFTVYMAAGRLGWKILLGNIFFLQEIRTTSFGSNRALWSLANEFWYYILFPLGLFAVSRGTSLRARILYGAAFIAIAVFVTQGVMALFPVWLLGTALALMKPPRIHFGAAMRWTAFVIYTPLVFVLAMLPWPWRYVKVDYVLGLLTALFLWLLLSAQSRANETALHVRLSRSLAHFSYSLYLVHYPMLAFLALLLTQHGVWIPTARALAAGAGLCLLAVVYAYGVAALTEFHNDSVRGWIEAKLGLKPRAKAAAAGR
jgi:peptidoglycan/LPS O-acetylase OafA/YrhL